MKVLLVSPNLEFLPDPVFPIGLTYIAGALTRHKIDHEVLDLCFVEDYETAIRSTLSRYQPDVVGLSLRNIDNVSYPNYVSYLPFYRKIVQTVRDACRTVIVIGGSGFSILPEAILKDLKADFGIVGEGELSFISLLNQLDDEMKYHIHREPRLLDFSSEITHDLNCLPKPDRSGFDSQAYLKWGGMGSIQTKRGCPFQCIYCTYPVIEGNKLRLRHVNQVCDDIQNILESGIDNLFFVDNAFNYPIEHALTICREIIIRKLSIKWSCYANPKYVTRELIDCMLEAGCTGLEFGTDTATRRMLLNMGKNFTVDDLYHASSVCRQSGMSFCHSLLLGGPGETMTTVYKTLDRVRDMSPTAVICMIGIRVFPNTKLSTTAVKEGIISPEQNFLNPSFYLSPAIEKEILPFIEEFSKENPTWIFPGLNINMNIELQKKLRRFGIKGPLWEHMSIGVRARGR